MEGYFTEALKKIEDYEEVPYYLESKVRDLSSALSVRETGDIIHFLIKMHRIVEGIRYLGKNKALVNICRFLEDLKRVPQDKGRSKNAYEHTLNVLDKIPRDNEVLRWVGLLHDSGKVDSHKLHDNFYHHAKFSKQFAEVFTGLYDVPHKEKICNIIEHHMWPLD